MKTNEILFDRRVVEKNLREGLISWPDYQKALKALPDLEKEAQWVEIDEMVPRNYLRGILAPEKPAPDDKAAKK